MFAFRSTKGRTVGVQADDVLLTDAVWVGKNKNHSSFRFSIWLKCRELANLKSWCSFYYSPETGNVLLWQEPIKTWWIRSTYFSKEINWTKTLLSRWKPFLFRKTFHVQFCAKMGLGKSSKRAKVKLRRKATEFSSNDEPFLSNSRLSRSAKHK